MLLLVEMPTTNYLKQLNVTAKKITIKLYVLGRKELVGPLLTCRVFAPQGVLTWVQQSNTRYRGKYVGEWINDKKTKVSLFQMRQKTT